MDQSYVWTAHDMFASLLTVAVHDAVSLSVSSQYPLRFPTRLQIYLQTKRRVCGYGPCVCHSAPCHCERYHYLCESPVWMSCYVRNKGPPLACVLLNHVVMKLPVCKIGVHFSKFWSICKLAPDNRLWTRVIWANYLHVCTLWEEIVCSWEGCPSFVEQSQPENSSVWLVSTGGRRQTHARLCSHSAHTFVFVPTSFDGEGIKQ